MARDHLLDFTCYTMPRYQVGRHHRLFCDKLEAVERGEIKRLMVFTPPRHGKALEINTPIPTPRGWSRIVDLQPGDEVFDEAGAVCRVVARSPVWRNRSVFAVSTDCGDTITADAAHEWRVRLGKNGKSQMVADTAFLSWMMDAPYVDCPNGKGTHLRFAYAGKADTVCIEVDSPSHLFLAGRSMTPTHNSEIVSKRFPAWWIGKHPDKQIISSSYGMGLARDFGREVRNIVRDQSYANVFPGVALAADSQAQDRWHTSAGGIYVAAGVDTAVTGRGADLLIIDDPVKNRAEAESETVREAAKNWYRSVAYTRLMPDAPIVICQTRWHEDDLSGWLLNEMQADGDHWEVINLPALALPGDALGRAPGEALWPERYDEATLGKTRKVIGERDFGALYQQNPQPDGSAFFDISHCLESGSNGAPYDPPKSCWSVFATIDTAVKTGKQHDGTAVCYWAFQRDMPSALYLIDYDILQIEGSLLEEWLPSVFANLDQMAKAHGAIFGSLGAFIEDKASGSILIQQSVRRGLPVNVIDSVLTSLGKDERAINVSGYVHQRMVKVTRSAFEKVISYKGQYANHLIKQVFSFRLGVKDQQDDLLDCFTYGIILALGNRDGF
jgi:hypothetical protein